jgi:hypothetical protein
VVAGVDDEFLLGVVMSVCGPLTGFFTLFGLADICNRFVSYFGSAGILPIAFWAIFLGFCQQNRKNLPTQPQIWDSKMHPNDQIATLVWRFFPNFGKVATWQQIPLFEITGYVTPV